MSAESDAGLARRYLLGDATEDERTRIEEDYFEHETTLERLSAAEDDLIEDYLAGRLSPAERERFERVYLSVPRHRVRVETIRRLAERAAREGGGAPPHKASLASYGTWLALAASLVLAVAVGVWFLAPGAEPVPQSAAGPETPAPAAPAPPSEPVSAPPAPRTFAVTLSPAAVRSAADTPAVVIPDDVTAVALHFESDGDMPPLAPESVRIETVAGDAVWQGQASGDDLPPGAVARAAVPADRILPDDYIVILYGADERGVEREWQRYFLRVRDR
jgi:hypothetical protein